jgi:hypothetical protein
MELVTEGGQRSDILRGIFGPNNSSYITKKMVFFFMQFLDLTLVFSFVFYLPLLSVERGLCLIDFSEQIISLISLGNFPHQYSCYVHLNLCMLMLFQVSK